MMAAMRLALALTTLTGCTTYGYAAPGAATSTSSSPGRTGGTLEAALVVGDPPKPEKAATPMFVFGTRLKITENVQQLAPSFGVDYLFNTERAVLPFLGGGFLPFLVERADRGFGFGMASPYARLGLLALFGPSDAAERYGIVVLATTEYDVRFTSQPSEPYFGLALGLVVYDR